MQPMIHGMVREKCLMREKKREEQREGGRGRQTVFSLHISLIPVLPLAKSAILELNHPP